jgi:HEAT repeat protein
MPDRVLFRRPAEAPALRVYEKELAARHQPFPAGRYRIDPGVNVDPSVITTLIAAMKDTRIRMRSVARSRQGVGNPLALAASPDLVAAAHSSDPDLAREALNSLAKIKDMDAGPKLVDLLDSPNKDIKRDACVSVGILRTKDALPKLQSIFQNDSDQKDKEAAMQGLAYLGDKVSVPTVYQSVVE